jgi:hypothetical protein
MSATRAGGSYPAINSLYYSIFLVYWPKIEKAVSSRFSRSVHRAQAANGLDSKRTFWCINFHNEEQECFVLAPRNEVVSFAAIRSLFAKLCTGIVRFYSINAIDYCGRLTKTGCLQTDRPVFFGKQHAILRFIVSVWSGFVAILAICTSDQTGAGGRSDRLIKRCR